MWKFCSVTPQVSITSCIRAAETASCLLQYLSSFLRTLKPDKVSPRKEHQKLFSFMSKHGKVLNETHASLPLTFHWTEHTCQVAKKTRKYILYSRQCCAPLKTGFKFSMKSFPPSLHSETRSRWSKFPYWPLVWCAFISALPWHKDLAFCRLSFTERSPTKLCDGLSPILLHYSQVSKLIFKFVTCPEGKIWFWLFLNSCFLHSFDFFSFSATSAMQLHNFLKMYSSMHSCFTRKFVQAIQTSSCPSESSLWYFQKFV